MRIESVSELISTINSGPYAFPGGYPKYFITKCNSTLSFDAVKENLPIVKHSIENDDNDGWLVTHCDINWEDEIYCEHTNKLIESAY